MLEDLDAEITLACKVAVLRAAGYRRHEAQRQLRLSRQEWELVHRRVERAAELLEQGDREELER